MSDNIKKQGDKSTIKNTNDNNSKYAQKYNSKNKYIDRLSEKPFSTSIYNSFNKTNLDIRNSLPNGGPINDLRYGYIHRYLPSNNYSEYIEKYKNKDLDISNLIPNEEPTNDPRYGYVQRYLPSNNYSEYIEKYKNKDFIEDINNKRKIKNGSI